MCFLDLWGRLVRSRKSRKRCLELGLAIFGAVLWLVATTAVVGLFLIYADFRSALQQETKGGDDDDDVCNDDCPPPLFAICDEIANGTFNASAVPPSPEGPPIVICEGGPTPLETYAFGGSVLNTTKAEGTWVRVRRTVVINAVAEFKAAFDAAGSSSGYITLRTSMAVAPVQHRGSGTVEVTSGVSFWLCPAQVISEGSFLGITYYCATGILSQVKISTVSFTIMVQAQ